MNSCCICTICIGYKLYIHLIFAHTHNFASGSFQCCEDPFFNSLTLFADEAGFTRNRTLNFHNMHIRSAIKPYSTIWPRRQQQFSIKVWARSVRKCFTGPHILPHRLNGNFPVIRYSCIGYLMKYMVHAWLCPIPFRSHSQKSHLHCLHWAMDRTAGMSFLAKSFPRPDYFLWGI